MASGKHKSVSAAFFGGLVWCALTGPALSVNVGPYFPVPQYFTMSGSAKDALLKLQDAWLQSGIAALKKARAEAAAQPPSEAVEQKIKDLDDQLAAATKEAELAANEEGMRDVQLERKRALLANVVRWANALDKLATEQLKLTLLKDGAERDEAERMNRLYASQAEQLETARTDPSIEAWGKN
ncbi:MAG: hypothetical protein HYS06_09815 [Methylocystis sp.]|nr:hypothetical protein [Methylocystis sp.]MBI3274996.1 hypothetical protein [Methylocystis sp.]